MMHRSCWGKYWPKGVEAVAMEQSLLMDERVFLARCIALIRGRNAWGYDHEDKGDGNDEDVNLAAARWTPRKPRVGRQTCTGGVPTTLSTHRSCFTHRH